MNTKKLLVVFITLLLIFSAFTACSEKDNTSKDSASVVTVTDKDGKAVTDKDGKAVTEKKKNASSSTSKSTTLSKEQEIIVKDDKIEFKEIEGDDDNKTTKKGDTSTTKAKEKTTFETEIIPIN